jgi:hypothetical protein
MIARGPSRVISARLSKQVPRLLLCENPEGPIAAASKKGHHGQIQRKVIAGICNKGPFSGFQGSGRFAD